MSDQPNPPVIGKAIVGWEETTIDDKGRILVGKKKREKLGEDFVIAVGTCGCLVAYPAEVFMGDVGALALGGALGTIAVIVRQEIVLSIMGGVFVLEALSVMLQVGYFKYTKKKYGEGRRVFLMSPLHHHYQKLGYHESKIAVRFWIVTILSMIVAIVTLKLR